MLKRMIAAVCALLFTAMILTVPALADSNATDGEDRLKDLVVTMETAGTQGAHNKWFQVFITLSEVDDDDTFVISLADDGDSATTDGNANLITPTASSQPLPSQLISSRRQNQGKMNPQYVTGMQFKNGVSFYICHGQSIVIRGILPEAGYSVVMDSEDYKSTPRAVEGYTDPVSGNIGQIAGTNKVIRTSFVNRRDGIFSPMVMTIILIAMGVILLAAVVIALVMSVRRGRHEND